MHQKYSKKKILESSKKQNLNLLHAKSCAESRWMKHGGQHGLLWPLTTSQTLDLFAALSLGIDCLKSCSCVVQLGLPLCYLIVLVSIPKQYRITTIYTTLYCIRYYK